MKFISLLFRMLVSTVTVILLLSCARSNEKMTPPLEFEDDYLNNQVVLLALAQENTFKTTDVLILRMTFKTDSEIVFPNNYNLRLFIREKEVWKEIHEKPRERLPEGNFVFSPNTSHQLPVIFLEPDLENIQQEHLLRIYVSGEMIDGEQFKTVASFIDIELKP